MMLAYDKKQPSFADGKRAVNIEKKRKKNMMVGDMSLLQ